MRIAIHHAEESSSTKWFTYCKQQNISFKIVNCFDSNIIEQLKKCVALMWHYYYLVYRNILFAKQLLFSLEQVGIKLKLQSCAFDFISDENKNPLIIEMSFAFGTKGSEKSSCFWTSDLKWHEGMFNPQVWMVEELING